MGEKGLKRKKRVSDVLPYLGAVFLVVFLVYCSVTPDFFWKIRKGVRHIYYGRIVLTGLVVLLGFYTCFGRFHKEGEREKKKGALIFLLTPVVSFLMLEYASTAGPSLIWHSFKPVPVLRTIFTLIILVILLFILYVVTNSMFASGSLICIAVIVFDLANYYTYTFRGIPLLASDLTAIETAVSVAGNYEYKLDYHRLVMVVCMVEWCILLFRIKKIKIAPKKHLKCAIAGIAVFAVCAFTALYSPIIPKVARVYVSTYRPNKSYLKNGVILTFVRSIQLMFIDEPEGYSAKRAEEIAAPYRNSKESEQESCTPNVIAIMDEAFADLQAVGDFETSEDLMPYYRSLTENAVKGFVHVSVFGGQTVNTEFEFLTGLSKAFLPEGSTAYRLYIKGPLPSLTTALKKQEYQGLLALHPYLANGYSRQTAYPYLGFADFISREDMTYDASDKIRTYISDEKDMQTIIEEYEKAKAVSGAPFYLFNVTMQNHSSYAKDYPNFEQTITVQEGYDFPEVKRYVNLVRKTDEALEHLIAYFSKVEEPTVIVFFGDHEPGLPMEFYSKLFGKDVEKLSRKETMEMYKTPFLIWANYEIEEKEDVHISSNYLSTLMMETAGMEMPPLNRFLAQLCEEVPILTSNGYYGDDGKLYILNDKKSPYYERICEYQILQYNDLFDTRNRINDFFD